MTTTSGTLLGGRVHYTQLADGYRTGLEPVLLAAAIPARSGDRVLEAGCGAGAGLLCLAARVSGLEGTGIERDPTLAALAAANFQANDVTTIQAVAADITQWRAAAPYDHAFANPPWHEHSGTASPVAGRLAAKQAPPGLLAAWAAALARNLRPQGTLSVILPAAHLAEATAALTGAHCGDIAVTPLWKRHGKPAKLLILQATLHGRGPDSVRPGLILHDDRGFTAEAESILRGGAAL